MATQSKRRRAMAWAIALPVVVIGGMAWVPMPHAVRAPGVVTSAVVAEVYARAEGVIESLSVPSGESVKAGDVVVQLINPELEDLRMELAAALREIEARRASAWSNAPAVLQPLDKRRESVQAQLQEVDDQLASLSVRAPRDGVWSSPEMEWRVGAEVPRGVRLGRLYAADEWVFDAVVAQRDVDRLTRSSVRNPEVRLQGMAATAIPTGEGDLRPAETQRLPSAALGWQAGGVVPTDPEDPDGLRAADPFFKLRAALPDGAVPDLFLRTGVMRVGLDWQPWGVQAWRRLRQFVQERYGR